MSVSDLISLAAAGNLTIGEGKQSFQAGASGFVGRVFSRIKQTAPAYRDYPQSSGAVARSGAIYARMNFASHS